MGKKDFKRQGSSNYKRVKDSWRKPKGGDSKIRKEKKGKPKLVKVGYRKPESERGLHPSGYREVLVDNPQEVEEVDPEKQAIRIASAVGKRKRIKIIEKAKENGIKVLNIRRERRESGNTETDGG
ncbi:50S ribosomal protein L32 [candidate division MSBL1 archaeon SCGC-AAA259I09]|uniref:Large ribosomal subunit protein eL32 n=2 Tax=candidate division MSBL1 TaxID=215777 RepID=A0A133UQE1_9EURY|nr:50S ribosomal protein L32 [candidate division MSBL1 archaeon SCGC-AAA259D14]KXA96336.1 50S ribosomal protein L32 [candidate division MSBL1 archaeon SCGC-AAA259I09]